jgi:hypothetical protein
MLRFNVDTIIVLYYIKTCSIAKSRSYQLLQESIYTLYKVKLCFPIVLQQQEKT